ncbi:MAG: hypothetical protein VX934_04755, partial [Cyanobacteriota bacterium]|nr:hypothetical protein [Cyanobacteriota bacterium]
MARHAISASSGKKVTASAAGLPKQPTSSALASRPKTDEKKKNQQGRMNSEAMRKSDSQQHRQPTNSMGERNGFPQSMHSGI